ncbi:MAG: hypothetical protein PWQ17_1447 [Anaerophaga sp.]|nr:hypothetical protein [Anaerophaga sp.]
MLSAIPETLKHPCNVLSGVPERLSHPCMKVSGRPENQFRDKSGVV